MIGAAAIICSYRDISGAFGGGGITSTCRELSSGIIFARARRSSNRVGFHDPPSRSVCAIGQVRRISAQMGTGSSM